VDHPGVGDVPGSQAHERSIVGPEGAASLIGHDRKRRRDDNWDYWIDRDKKLAYARIYFSSSTLGKDLERVLKDLCRQGMKGLILDLRGNPGGLLQASVEVSELFVGAKPICTIRPRVGAPHPFEGQDKRVLPPFGLACLIDADTASSAEILAACIQDHRRGLVVGQRSHGKGSVRNIQMFDDRDLAITTAVFYRPSGKKLDRMRIPGRPAGEWGVIPDIPRALTPREREALKAHLERAEIVSGDPAVWEEIRGGLRDHQRDLALLLLRARAALPARG
jgi:carboxyl-terminal processing protease